MPSAELDDLTIHVDTGRWSETVAEGVSLAVPGGRITALLGESGCGKSMVAAALTGSLPASATSTGQVRINGTAVQDRRQWRQLRGGTVGLLPQDGVTAFAADASVGAQLADLQRTYKAWSVEDACAAARYPIENFELYPKQHSAGQIQRAALAAALLPAPEVLIADEPTASLDMDTGYDVWVTLRAYADAGAAVLVITHDAPLLVETRVAEDLVFLREGRVVASGSRADMRAHADPYVQGFFRPFGE
ncbi:ATP-binding cassette domain-containing protein [Amycolatopsis jiangsuensis]|uniref:Peptide/nickel transport system ATP-binding protein n=1 Tax=Amycolatopsis jiangsuensis TaxID=1181879 RepID=A0A840IVQ8_9PSEU|nr:ATP-binding cassette domain-containing protein [Amycolatopsis jiangsuensis]MBB4685950.1 peptide/nickel transport system ATP-binding protein [Amycolatopsis jiangsuensis]